MTTPEPIDGDDRDTIDPEQDVVDPAEFPPAPEPAPEPAPADPEPGA